MFHRGVPRTACTETPGQAEIFKRIEANAAIIHAFCKFHQDLALGPGAPERSRTAPKPGPR